MYNLAVYAKYSDARSHREGIVLSARNSSENTWSRHGESRGCRLRNLANNVLVADDAKAADRPTPRVTEQTRCTRVPPLGSCVPNLRLVN